MAEEPRDQAGRRYWLDDPQNVTKIVWTLVAVCVALFFADAAYDKHGHFAIEDLFGFFAIFGFVVCVALVLAAKWMRTFLMRPEDYYEREYRGRGGAPANIDRDPAQ
jgi:hypothetical protein